MLLSRPLNESQIQMCHQRSRGLPRETVYVIFSATLQGLSPRLMVLYQFHFKTLLDPLFPNKAFIVKLFSNVFFGVGKSSTCKVLPSIFKKSNLDSTSVEHSGLYC